MDSWDNPFGRSKLLHLCFLFLFQLVAKSERDSGCISSANLEVLMSGRDKTVVDSLAKKLLSWNQMSGSSRRN